MVAAYQIRLFGDPVLTQRSAEVTDIDGSLAHLVDDMVETMHQAQGLGLAAPQVGVQKRLFVYQLEGRDPVAVINPTIAESRGEWEFEEGCLSIPGLYFPIVRPKEIHLTGWDLDGQEISIEADEHRGPLLPARARPPRRAAAHLHAGQGPAQGSDARTAPAG